MLFFLDTSLEDTITLFNLMPEGLEMPSLRSLFQRDRKKFDRCEKRKIIEEALARRELPAGYTIPEGYNPYTWYLETKRRAANGDKEAIEKLKYPQVRLT